MPVYEISPQDVQARLAAGERLVLVDVRQPWEYERSHIAGALLLPLGQLAARHAEVLDPNDEIICLCEHGVRSLSAARFLSEQGCARVATMTGGMSAYAGPVETGQAAASE